MQRASCAQQHVQRVHRAELSYVYNATPAGKSFICMTLHARGTAQPDCSLKTKSVLLVKPALIPPLEQTNQHACLVNQDTTSRYLVKASAALAHQALRSPLLVVQLANCALHKATKSRSGSAHAYPAQMDTRPQLSALCV
jgi:hypothetical protein